MNVRQFVNGPGMIVLLFVAFILGYTRLFGLMETPDKVEPEKTESTFRKAGIEALQDGHRSLAVILLEKNLLLDPTCLQTRFYLARALELQGLYGRALGMYQRIVALDSLASDSISLEALERLGELYTREGRVEDSRTAYIDALQRESRTEKILMIRNQLAELALTEGTYKDDGNTLFNDMGEVIGGVGPGDMRTNREFEIARHTRNWSLKEIHFSAAARSDPGMHQAWFNTGLALLMQSRFDEAIPFFERADSVWQTREDINPSRGPKATALAYTGLCYLKLGDTHKALELCDRALHADGGHFHAYLFRAMGLNQASRPLEAVQILNSLLFTEPEDRDVLMELHHAHNALGNLELAAIALSHAKSVEQAELFSELGKLSPIE